MARVEWRLLKGNNSLGSSGLGNAFLEFLLDCFTAVFDLEFGLLLLDWTLFNGRAMLDDRTARASPALAACTEIEDKLP